MAQKPPLKNILIVDRFDEAAKLWLQKQDFLSVKHVTSQKITEADLLSTQGLIIRSQTQIDRPLLERARQLQVLVTATSGFDHIDLQACDEWGITVMHTPEANIESASQLTWSLILSGVHRFKEALQLTQSGIWDRQKIIGIELSGRTLGIIGLGRIGSRVSKLAQAFGMNVIAYDPYQSKKYFDHLNVRSVSLDELGSESDIITLHTPKTEETLRLLSENRLQTWSRKPLLVNAARGAITPENLILKALEQNWIRAAALDVFENEPLPASSALLKHPRVIVTPHIGASTEEAFAKASLMAAQKTVQFFLDGTATDILPPRATWYAASAH